MKRGDTDEAVNLHIPSHSLIKRDTQVGKLALLLEGEIRKRNKKASDHDDVKEL